MDSFFQHHRNSTVLVALVLGQVIGLATQVKRPDPRNSDLRNKDTQHSDGGELSLLRVWMIEAIAPPERFMVWTGEGIRNIWYGYFNLRHARQENAQLRDEVNRLRADRSRLYQEASRTQQLERFFGFKEQYVTRTVAAQVIGSSGTDAVHLMYIDKGSDNGVKTEMPVMTPDGIVGKVRDVGPKTAQVLLLNDSQSGVGVMLEKSHHQGIMKGSVTGHLEIHYIMSDEKIEPGEKVYTSGGDRIFPKGLEVGQVMSVAPDKDRDGFQLIRVHPNANLFRLEEVLVVTQVDEKMPIEESQETPAQLLAARLPGIDRTKIRSKLKRDAQGNPVVPPPPKPAKAIVPDRFSPPEEHATARPSDDAAVPSPKVDRATPTSAPKPKAEDDEPKTATPKPKAEDDEPKTTTPKPKAEGDEPKTTTPDTQEH